MSVLVTLSSALVVILVFVLLDPPSELNRTGIALFAAGGLAAPGISRWATNTGTHRLGPSVSGSITQGARPFLAVIGAIVFLGESLTVPRAVGLILIVSGGWRLSRPRRELVLPSSSGGTDPDRRWFRPGLVFPLLAALAYATQDVVTKEALSFLGDARFGALVGISTALLAWIVASVCVPAVRRELSFGDDFRWLILSGFLSGLAVINLFQALARGDVSLVSPITATQPLAVFVLSRLLLRKLEELHVSTVVSGISIVGGTVVLSV